jgi:hypothetical protein
VRKWRRDLACGDARCQTGRRNPPIRADASDHSERGLDVSYGMVRRWVLKFGSLIARKLRQGRPRPSARWHLDEMVVRIAGKRLYLGRGNGRPGGAQEGEKPRAEAAHRNSSRRSRSYRLPRRLLHSPGQSHRGEHSPIIDFASTTRFSAPAYYEFESVFLQQ